MTLEGRHANMVYLRELHKATILTKVHPKETAYGIDPHAAIEKRFKVMGARKSALATVSPGWPKTGLLKAETKLEPLKNPIIQEFMMNQELDSMLRQGAAETGPLHDAREYPIPTAESGPHTARPPREAEGHAQRAVGAQEDATQHSAAGAQGVAAAARQYTVNGTTAQCA